MQSLLAILITVVSGVLVYIIGEVLRDIWLAPLVEFKRLRSEVVFTLTFYKMNLFDSVDLMQGNHKYYLNDENVAVKEFLEEGAKLRAFIETLSWIKIGIPSKKNLCHASIALETLASVIVDEENRVPNDMDRYDYLEQQTELIEKCLRLYKG